MKSTIWALPVDTSSVALIKRVVASLVAPLLVLPTAPAHVFAQATQAAANDQGWPRECQSGEHHVHRLPAAGRELEGAGALWTRGRLREGRDLTGRAMRRHFGGSSTSLKKVLKG